MEANKFKEFSLIIQQNTYFLTQDGSSQLTVPYTLSIPLPFLILICVVAYIIIVLIILFVRSNLRQKNMCIGPEAPCGTEDDLACPCCATLADACDCCHGKHTYDACCNSRRQGAPERKRHDCVELLTCEICVCRNEQGNPVCGWMDCNSIKSDYCENSTCLCFRCNCRKEAPLLAT